MKHLIKVVLFLTIFLSSFLISNAQGVTPQYIVDAARQVAEADLPSIGEATGWSHNIINDVNNTSLGCVLVEGVPLPNPVDVYRVEMQYGDNNYSVYVTADASMVVLCDERFPGMRAGVVGANNADPNGDTDGDGVLNADDVCPTIAGVAGGDQSGCPAATEGDRDGDGVADGVDFCPDQAGSTESDGCPILTDTDGDGVPNVDDLCPSDAGVIQEDFADGCPLDGTGTSPSIRLSDSICRIVGDNVTLFDNAADNATAIGTYNNAMAESGTGNVIGRSSNVGFFQTTGGWVSSSAVTLTGDCFNIPIVNASVGSATGCFMRPSGTFANVRNGPRTTDTQVTTIYPNESYSVLGTDTSTDWIFFNRGWVSKTVLELSGTCDNLPRLDPQFVGSGSVFFCPPDYNGYLEPRITIGTANARISAGQLPNRLRAEPTANSEQIGEIQPGRTLDAILDGPACNEGYVWWQVNIDGTIGWTVENDINANAYYIEPFDESGNVIEEGVQPTPVVQAPPPSQEVNPTTFQMITSANLASVNTITTLPTESPFIVEWSPINSILAVVSTNGTIDFYGSPTFENINTQIVLPDSLQPTALAFSADDRFLAVGNSNGQVYVVELENGASLGGVFLAQSHTSPVRALTWTHEGYGLASASGFSQEPIDGAEWTLKVWDLNNFSPLTQTNATLSINYAFPYPLTDVAYSMDDQWVSVTGETSVDQQAAIWIYNTTDTELYFSKGLVYMQGFSAVTDTPATSLGDFVYNNGDTAYRITVSTEEDVQLYRESGNLLNEIAFRSQVIEGAEVLMAVTNATPGGYSGEETVTFVNALNVDSPTGSLTVSTTDIAFSPDGRILAVTDVINSRVVLLGVTDS